MKKACLYTRYSSHSQSERSIEGQIQDAQRYAALHDIEIVKIYEEPHRSGTNADSRPVFQQMIKDCEHRPWDIVLVWKLDRFARNRYDAAMYRSKLKKNDIKIISIMEQITDSAEGIMLESLLEGMAEYYSANLAENIRRGQRLTREKGEWHGGEPPFGYQIENKHLVENQKNAPIVRMIFNDYRSGVPMAEIVRHLNDLGIKTTRNKPFTYSILGNILRCERYIGVTRYQGEIVNSDGVALIDEDTYKAVQKMLDNHKRNKASAHSKVDYILTDKLFCGTCGEAMIGNSGTGKAGKTYYYYSCTANKHKRTCSKKNEPKDELEDFIVTRTVEALSDEETINSIASRIVDCYNKEFNFDRISELEKEIEKHNRELDKLTDQLLEASNQRIKNRINERIDSESAILDELEDDLRGQRQASKIHRLTEDDVKAYIRGVITGDKSDPAFRKNLVDTFINSIYVYDDDGTGGKILINYHLRNSETLSWSQSSELLSEFGRTPTGSIFSVFVRTQYTYKIFSLVFYHSR